MHVRSFLLGLSLAGAFIVGCVAGRSEFVVPPVQAEGTGQRWQYTCFGEGNGEALVKKANKLGRLGWEMSGAASHGAWAPIWCFRHPR